jgi:Amt family ammonium transporter
MDWCFNSRPTVLGMITGVVAGLVAITPAAGFVTPMGALGIGIGAGVTGYLSVAFMKAKLGYDDTLDAFGVHGVGGFWGAIATGLWATKAVNPAGAGADSRAVRGGAVDGGILLCNEPGHSQSRGPDIGAARGRA